MKSAVSALAIRSVVAPKTKGFDSHDSKQVSYAPCLESMNLADARVHVSNPPNKCDSHLLGVFDTGADVKKTMSALVV